MCGILGYYGSKRKVVDILQDLKKLEYRGYDSCGVSYINSDNNLVVNKTLGGVSNLIRQFTDQESNSIISHTRWATTGKVCTENCHPHLSEKHIVSVVHNGIIENYKFLRDKLLDMNYNLISDTDSEVIAHLIEYYYVNNYRYMSEEGRLSAIAKTLSELQGTYALIIQFFDGELFVARRSNPLYLSSNNDNDFYISSDISAFPSNCIKYNKLEEDKVVRVGSGDVTWEDIPYWEEYNELGDYDHYMIKEIVEEPDSIYNAIKGRLNHSEVILGGIKSYIPKIKSADKIYLVGCGSSSYAAMVGKYWIEKYSGIPTEVVVASNTKSLNYIRHSKSEIAIFISQSGETADIIKAINQFKELGITCLGIVNRVNSTIASLTEAGVYIHAGIEIGVAATKSFMNQLVVLHLLALSLSDKCTSENIDNILSLPNVLLANLDQLQHPFYVTKSSDIDCIAARIANNKKCYFIGANYDYAIALEGALKLKEVSYIHSEAFYSGELKHGPLATIGSGDVVIVINNSDESISVTSDEIRSRGGYVIEVIPDNFKVDSEYIPYVNIENNKSLNVFSITQIFQLLAYKVAIKLGEDPDKPRNLAKSVTVL